MITKKVLAYAVRQVFVLNEYASVHSGVPRAVFCKKGQQICTQFEPNELSVVQNPILWGNKGRGNNGHGGECIATLSTQTSSLVDSGAAWFLAPARRTEHTG